MVGRLTFKVFLGFRVRTEPTHRLIILPHDPTRDTRSPSPLRSRPPGRRVPALLAVRGASRLLHGLPVVRAVLRGAVVLALGAGHRGRPARDPVGDLPSAVRGGPAGGLRGRLGRGPVQGIELRECPDGPGRPTW